MEVHHHPHVGKKSFTAYLLEGLMIFLAVTLGFIAENIREHITEKRIAKELAENLYKEIYSDSILIRQSIEGRRNAKAKDLNHFIQFVKDSSLAEPSESFYKAVFSGFLRNYYFEPKDGILSQLRNSGSLRFFKSKTLQGLIGRLSVSIADIRTRNATERDFTSSTLRPFLINHFDYTWFAAQEYKDQTAPPALRILNIPAFDKNEAINLAAANLMLMRSTIDYQYEVYATFNHQLMDELRKEFRIRNE